MNNYAAIEDKICSDRRLEFLSTLQLILVTYLDHSNTEPIHCSAYRHYADKRRRLDSPPPRAVVVVSSAGTNDR